MARRTVHKFGAAIGVTTANTIISGIFDVLGSNAFPAAAAALTVVSSDDEDAVGGAGATSVYVEGLRGSPGSTYRDFATVVLTGTTPTATVWADGFRAYRAYATAGAVNVGNVDVLIGGVVANRIKIGDGATETTTFSVADDEEGYILQEYVSMLKSAGTTPRVQVRTAIKPFSGPWRHTIVPVGVTEAGGAHFITFALPGVHVPFGHDVKMEVDTIDATSADVTAGYDIDVRPL